MNKNSFLKFLFQAGLFGFLGVVVGGLINWGKDSDLSLKQFKYGLVKEAIAISDKQLQKERVEFLYDAGLLDNGFMERDTLIFKLNYQRGRLDSKAFSSLRGAIREFYSVENRVPKSLSELSKAINISKPLELFNQNVHYFASDERTFRLFTPGEDGVLFTGDDKVLDFSGL